ncbi:deoxyribodipyrimidine photo-lyase [Shewanella sp. A25]|nr:deoxyribodipyrimidine photo-lyase [Shewanella shenzhenensis]
MGQHAQARQHALMWFRQDLRLNDNQALTAACEWIRDQNPIHGSSGNDVSNQGAKLNAIFIATPKQWQRHDVAPIQLDFIERHVNLLADGLAELGIEFELIELDTFDEIPEFLSTYCRAHGIARVFAGGEPEINERQRDDACVKAGVPLSLTNEHCLLPPGSVLNLSGDMYRVFTPFSRKWREIACQKAIIPLSKPAPLGTPIPAAQELSFTRTHKRSSKHWAAGEVAARDMLTSFIEQKVQDYKQDRDYPALDGTSSISPYLTIGVLSPRQCIAALLERYPEAIVDDTSKGRTWLNELVWREFYRHLLVAFPELSMSRNFNRLADNIRWRNDETEFHAWCEGRTGYPIVDAAMRQLNQIGWMHNRLRMVVASFLTKHLLIDWRWGERYFRQHLIDGDLAANNGGWQWSAGCGCDAQPYFRIFNPINQSEKFDPDGSFIRHYLPELASWGIKRLHQPNLLPSHKSSELSLFDMPTEFDYPIAIVEHSKARARALEVLGVLKKA